jgi:hypothetical protein
MSLKSYGKIMREEIQVDYLNDLKCIDDYIRLIEKQAEYNNHEKDVCLVPACIKGD